MIIDNTFSFQTIVKNAYKRRIPLIATIELLTLCNLKCLHCYIPKHDNKGLEYSFILDLFEELKKLGTLETILTGGEIFLHPDIMEIIKKAREMGFRVTLLSNATLINDSQIEQLSKLYITEFSTTIFSLNEEINDKITGVKGSLKKILSNIMKMKNKGISLEIKTPIMQQNKYSYKYLQEFCNINDFLYSPNPTIMSKINGDSSPKDNSLDFNDLIEFNKNFNLNINVNRKNLKDKKNLDDVCPNTRYSLYIDSNKNVYPCNSFLYKVGDLKKQSLKDIWYNSSDLKFIYNLTNKELEECKNCDLENICNRCPGLAYSEDNDLFGCSSINKQNAKALKYIIDSERR
ncbi:hypothetical protein OSSY52_13140 [Tepiditoga spiralis]|uniref:Radical SAM core domain-containing protein n=1 Tax=Tepiditoga spiralis TaxID=2108365 RepID=A0A7G1G8D4_9BACT|nr:radical SAM protein [Tepiditoga spiralis]BBE31173.1 hypothetical protein OSSY52_13140 [Tepiditoga spiralis]